jgi:hypothetical protein
VAFPDRHDTHLASHTRTHSTAHAHTQLRR